MPERPLQHDLDIIDPGNVVESFDREEEVLRRSDEDRRGAVQRTSVGAMVPVAARALLSPAYMTMKSLAATVMPGVT